MSEKPTSFFSLRFRLWGLFTAAGVVASLSTLLGFLGRFSWFLDLFAHFRVQYMLGLVVIAAIMFSGRRRGTAVVFLAFVCVNLILVLEEISAEWISDLRTLTNVYPHSITQPRDDNFGIGVFSKLPLVEGEVCYIGSAGVPSIVATVDAGHSTFRLLATHPLPPGGREYSRRRDEQLELLPDYIQSPLPVLLLGDLNVTPWSFHFRRLLARSGLRDSAKGFGVQPTWPSFSMPLRIPIDHCLHSAEIVVVDRRIGRSVSSDHYPLIIYSIFGSLMWYRRAGRSRRPLRSGVGM